jgi:hypothetical protein
MISEEFWIPAFAGMTTGIAGRDRDCHATLTMTRGTLRRAQGERRERGLRHAQFSHIL